MPSYFLIHPYAALLLRQGPEHKELRWAGSVKRTISMASAASLMRSAKRRQRLTSRANVRLAQARRRAVAGVRGGRGGAPVHGGKDRRREKGALKRGPRRTQERSSKAGGRAEWGSSAGLSRRGCGGAGRQDLHSAVKSSPPIMEQPSLVTICGPPRAVTRRSGGPNPPPGGRGCNEPWSLRRAQSPPLARHPCPRE